MMLIDVKVPVLSESITEGTLISWHKQTGEFVRRDEVLVELETDKVVLEIVAPDDGVLTEIKKANGTTVGSSEVLAIIDSEAKASLQATRSTPSSQAEPAVITSPPESSDTKLSPAVRKLIAEHDIEAEDISGTGKDGRITKSDVLKHIANPPAQTQQTPTSAVTPQLETSREERRVPMTRLRSRIAERLKEAQNTAAMLTTFNEVNMQPVMDLRNRYKDKFEKEYGIKLGFMSFSTKAVIEGLKKFPVINASIDGSDIVYHGYFDISIAVSSPRGLVVPVVRNADVLSFSELEHHISDYAIKAREGKLSIDDLTGGTFTVSNGGVFGSLLSTPILNPPQSGILGMHKTQIRPIVENGEIVARPMMYIALSYDHRIVDGKEAVQFLITVKEMLEDPSRLLLQI